MKHFIGYRRISFNRLHVCEYAHIDRLIRFRINPDLSDVWEIFAEDENEALDTYTRIIENPIPTNQES